MIIKDVNLEVNGMQCSSCELKIEEALKKEKGVLRAKASRLKNIVSIKFDSDQTEIERISSIIEKAGYKVSKISILSKKNPFSSYILTFLIFTIIVFLFILQQRFGVHFLPVITPGMGYGILFLVGILTSIHCVGMCGGINLSQSINKENKKFVPTLAYNTGRLLSYTIVGGLAGGIGRLFSLSALTKGLIFLIAGIFMFLMGMNLLGLFSKISFISKPFYKIYEKMGIKNKRLNPFVVGLLNGLMPCGPLQGMQIYALSMGSFISGALSMFFFALGTFPLMFGLGILANILSTKLSTKMMKVSGLIIIFLGLTMFSNGLTLTGNPILNRKDGNFSVAEVSKDIQTVVTKITPNSYPPIVVQKGVPVRWIIKADEADLNGCNNSIVIPAYNIDKKLQAGENIIEFTPTNEGNIYYSCWMGMISSTIKVVSDIKQADVITENEEQPQYNQGSCCAVGNNSRYSGGRLPLDKIGIAKIKDRIQEVVIDVDEYGYSPSVIVVQRNTQTKIKFNPKKLTSCNYVVVFPEYRGKLDLSVGQWETPLLNVSTDFTFTCWMGMLNGYVKVVDDIKQIDIEQIKKELENYRSPAGGGCCGG